MSFVADPLLLFGSGAIIERMVPDRRRARQTEQATLGVFLALSVPVYLDAGWTRPIWRTFRARSGRDFMLNSGVWHFEYRNPPRRTHVAATLVFATYPLWLHLGRVVARRGAVRKTLAQPTSRVVATMPDPDRAAASGA